MRIHDHAAQVPRRTFDAPPARPHWGRSRAGRREANRVPRRSGPCRGAIGAPEKPARGGRSAPGRVGAGLDLGLDGVGDGRAQLLLEVGVLVRRVRRVIHERARAVHADLQPASYLLLALWKRVLDAVPAGICRPREHYESG